LKEGNYLARKQTQVLARRPITILKRANQVIYMLAICPYFPLDNRNNLLPAFHAIEFAEERISVGKSILTLLNIMLSARTGYFPFITTLQRDNTENSKQRYLQKRTSTASVPISTFMCL
jgi:hypothetical protein